MYSFASLAALTRVSVPWTGRANESMMTSDVPTTLPCIRPIISYGTPDRAWITYNTRRLSDGSKAPNEIAHHFDKSDSRNLTCLEVVRAVKLLGSLYKYQTRLCHTYSDFHGSARSIFLFSSTSYLYISSWGETFAISFARLNDCSAAFAWWAMAASNLGGGCFSLCPQSWITTITRRTAVSSCGPV